MSVWVWANAYENYLVSLIDQIYWLKQMIRLDWKKSGTRKKNRIIIKGHIPCSKPETIERKEKEIFSQALQF